MLDLELLRAFVTVADCGGFHRAAERLNLTQSTVSQQIKRLALETSVPCSGARHAASRCRWRCIGTSVRQTISVAPQLYATEGRACSMLAYGFSANTQNQRSFSTTVAFVRPAAVSVCVNPWFCCPE
jgi:hypothetical protein